MPIDPATVITPLSKIPNFDPRAVPVHGVDAHLPAVPAAAMDPASLRQRFADPPPWQPEVWTEPRFVDRPPARAAVLVPLVMREQPTVLLTRRTDHLSNHAGHVAFPGGRHDETDADDAETALREAEEEIGLPRALAEVIGTMPTYKTGTQFVITPVVALVQPDYPLAINEYEVAEAFEVPLAFLMDPANHRRHRFEWSGASREWFSMPYQDGAHERFIWGATAAMLRNFYRFLAA
jgi:8-oxo-dGTP pyrophosphatase MutT (NUDIX family)